MNGAIFIIMVSISRVCKIKMIYFRNFSHYMHIWLKLPQYGICVDPKQLFKNIILYMLYHYNLHVTLKSDSFKYLKLD